MLWFHLFFALPLKKQQLKKKTTTTKKQKIATMILNMLWFDAAINYPNCLYVCVCDCVWLPLLVSQPELVHNVNMYMQFMTVLENY